MASSLSFPFFLAVLMALLKSLANLVSSFLKPTPTPLPKAPPEKVGPTKTTGLPYFSA